MTTIAWDGHKLVADSRVFVKHTWEGKDAFPENDLAYLRDEIVKDHWLVENSYMEVQDDVRKIFVPKKHKPLTYRGMRVQAIGVSGEVGAIEALEQIPRGTELITHGTFVNGLEVDVHLLVVTREQVFEHQIENPVGRKHRGTTFALSQDRDKFLSIGAGYMPPFNGNEPILDSEAFVNFACLMNTLSGGPRWIWDSATNELTRKEAPSFQQTRDNLRRFFKKEVGTLHIAAKLNDAIKDPAKALSAAKAIVRSI